MTALWFAVAILLAMHVITFAWIGRSSEWQDSAERKIKSLAGVLAKHLNSEQEQPQ